MLHLGLDSEFMYKTTAILFVCVSFFIIINMIINKDNSSHKNLKKISFIICLILLYYTLSYTLIDGVRNLTMLYVVVFSPLCIYCTKISIKNHVRALLIIYVSTVVGVYYIFYIGLIDVSKLDEIQTILRPGEDRIEKYEMTYRNGGYLGSCHDAANILSIIGIFLIANIISKESVHKLMSFCCLMIGSPALLLTTSATNISIFLFTALIMMLFFCRTLIRISAFSVFIIVLFYFLHDFWNERLFIFINKIKYHSETANGGMFNALNENSISSSLFSFLFGFADTLELPIINTELGILKFLIQFGLIPFLFLMYFLLLPLFISLKSGLNAHSFYYSFPLLASVISLFHYASLFRITSIGVFILLYSIFLVKYSNLDRLRYNFQ